MKKVFLLLFLALTLQVQAQTGKDAALEVIGGTGGLLLYNTYLVIGQTHDGFGGEVYDAATATTLVEEQLSGIETVKGQYSALIRSKFLTDPNDVQFVKEMLEAFDLVHQEGSHFVRYLKEDDQGALEDYEIARQAAWAKISSLLGLEEE
jgi:hypothetical protein